MTEEIYILFTCKMDVDEILKMKETNVPHTLYNIEDVKKWCKEGYHYFKIGDNHCVVCKRKILPKMGV